MRKHFEIQLKLNHTAIENVKIHKAIVKLYKKANMQAENIADALDLEINFVRNALKEEGIYS